MVAARRRYVQSLNWTMAAMYKPAVPSTLAAEKSVLSKPDNMEIVGKSLVLLPSKSISFSLNKK